MALYGSGRDASFVRLINKELVNRIVDIEIEYYQIALPSITENLYGESLEKIFYDPIRVPCLIDRTDLSVMSDEAGINYTRSSIFAFVRDTLVEKNLVITAGDFIKWDTAYYEVDLVNSGQYWSGRNPSTYPGNVFGETNEFGYSVSVVVETHKTRIDRLNIQKVRSGNNRRYHMPKNI